MNGLLRARLARIGASPTRHSTHVLKATYPRAVSSLGRHGVLIGRDVVTGNAFAYCPFTAYSATGADHLSNPNMVVAGDIGQGKSSLIQSYCARQGVFGRKTHAFSVKRKEGRGEYDNYAHVVGGNIVRVIPGGRVMVNPLDAVLTGDPEEDGLIRPIRIGVLEGLVETIHGRQLQSDESNALGLALDEVVAVNDQPTLPQVYTVFKDPTDAMCQHLKLSQAEWTTRLHDTRQALYALCEGKYAGLFNGHTSPDMRMDADHVVYDLEPLTRATIRAIIPMFMAVATGRLHNTLAKETDRNIIVVYEEGWRVLAHLGVVRFMQESWKLARAHGVQNIMVLHRPSDLYTAGHEGSLEAQLALGLLADTATKVVYRPQSQSLEATGQMLALTSDEVLALKELQVGEALWRIDDRSTIVRHTRSTLEAELFSSDAGMVRQGVAHAV